MARYEIRPLGLWDRPVTENRRSTSGFKASWDSTLKLLCDEVDLLGGDLIVVQVDADPRQIRRDGMLFARAVVGFPGVKVSFGSRHGPLTYATDAYDNLRGFHTDPPGWQGNVRAIALSLHALRAVDRYGITRSGEQYRGWTAIAAKPAEDTLTRDEAARVLADAAGLMSEPSLARASRGVVEAAFRKAAKTAHPDAGGNGDVFRLIHTARDRLLEAGDG